MWTIYIDDKRVPATFKHITEELNNTEGAEITLPNNKVFRDLVATDQDVDFKWQGATIFSGVLAGITYGKDTLKCKVYNKVYYLMDKKTITATYDTATAASTILTAICAEVAGVAAGTSSATTLTMRFNKTSCLEAFKFLAECLNLDYEGADGTTANIAARGTARGKIPDLSVSRRGVDRFKKRDKIYVRGVDVNGAEIVGEAGAGTNVMTFTEKKANDTTGLDNIAASRLAKLNKDSSGVVVTCSIIYAYNFSPGDTVTISNESLNLNGSYKIWRIKKTGEIGRLEIDVAESLLQRYLEKQKNWEDFGIYGAGADINLDMPVGAPGAPANPATVNQSLRVQVSWDENTEADLDGYRVLRHTSDASGSAGELARIGSNIYRDFQTPAYDTYYYYWVRAEDRVGNLSPYSATVSGLATPLQTVDIDDLAIENAKIAVAAISGAVIAAKGITTTHITDNAIESPLIKAGAVIAGKLATNSVVAANIQAGNITSDKITSAQIVAKDFRTATNVGQAGVTGVRFFASGIYGYRGTTKTFYWQAADGKAYAGAGTVILDDDGITIRGINTKKLIIKSGSTQLGAIETAGEVLKISTTLGGPWIDFGLLGANTTRIYNPDGTSYFTASQIRLQPAAGGSVIITQGETAHMGMKPGTTNRGYIGSDGAIWWKMYANELRANNVYGTGHWGDVWFRDLECVDCNEKFEIGDEIGFKVIAESGGEIGTVPAHNYNCTSPWNKFKKVFLKW